MEASFDLLEQIEALQQQVVQAEEALIAAEQELEIAQAALYLATAGVKPAARADWAATISAVLAAAFPAKT